MPTEFEIRSRSWVLLPPKATWIERLDLTAIWVRNGWDVNGLTVCGLTIESRVYRVLRLSAPRTSDKPRQFGDLRISRDTHTITVQRNTSRCFQIIVARTITLWDYLYCTILDGLFLER